MKQIFRMPTQMKITGRTSTMTHAFITSIIPHIEPTEKQVRKSLEILHISPDNITCAYCGNAATECDLRDKSIEHLKREVHQIEINSFFRNSYTSLLDQIADSLKEQLGLKKADSVTQL